MKYARVFAIALVTLYGLRSCLIYVDRPTVWQITSVLETDWHAETRTKNYSSLAGGDLPLDLRFVNDKTGKAVVIAYGGGVSATFASRRPGEIEITVPNEANATYYNPVIPDLKIIMHFTPKDDPERRARYFYWFWHRTEEESRVWFCENIFSEPEYQRYAEQNDKWLAVSAYEDKGPSKGYCLNRY